jgi:uncharacterized protein with FMN-binding domain
MRKSPKLWKRALLSLLVCLPLAGCDQSVGGPPPDPPARVDKLIPGPAQITASWPAAAGADYYEVWLSLTDKPSDAVLRQTVDAPFALIDGLDWQKTYWVWVRSKNQTGLSSFAAPLSATPLRMELYNEGFYWSAAESMGVETVVGATFSAYAIVDVEIIDSWYDNTDLPEVALALETLPAAIVAANTPDVDGVTGATETSDRIKDAVRKNMEQAKK